MLPSPSADVSPLRRDPLTWRRLDSRVADRFLEFDRNRTIAVGFTALMSVVLLAGTRVLSDSLAAGSLSIGFQDRVALAYAFLAALLGAWAIRLRRCAPRRRITPLCLATFLVAFSLAVAVQVIGTETAVQTPEIYLVVVMLALAGLLPLPPARFAVVALPAVVASITMVAAIGSSSSLAMICLLGTVGLIAVVMAYLNFRRLRSMFASQNDADDAIAERDQFLRILAHDLRGPIGVLPGFVSLIRHKADTEPRSDLTVELDVLESTARGIRSLLDNTLLWGRTRDGSISPTREVVDVVEILHALMQSLAASAHLKEIDFASDLPDSLPVLSDGELLRTIVRNLVDNAIKFTEPGGAVSLSCGREGDEAVITVRDTGIGMAPEEDQPQRAGTDGEHGSGIGLGLVAALAGRIGATVTFESAPGKGTLAKVSLASGIPPEHAHSGSPEIRSNAPIQRAREGDVVWTE